MESVILRFISLATAYSEPHLIIADTNECNIYEVCGDVAECENVVGTYKCNCPDGYTFDVEGKNCYGMFNTWRQGTQ